MAHLTCKLHKRRVIAVAGKFIHRNGNGGVCNSVFAGIMGEEYTAQGIAQFGMVRPPRSEKVSESHRCQMGDCSNNVPYDDEPYCYDHASDSGSYVRGYSFKKSEEARKNKVELVNRLKSEGMANIQIAKKLGIVESSVRTLLK